MSAVIFAAHRRGKDDIAVYAHIMQSSVCDDRKDIREGEKWDCWKSSH
ncbi:conserved domain protein [Ruminococcus albus 8]|uniref:Conserved domain protein n=1 Tax=Ruminococcus albus 8 TaxID=246199 RepID=E9SHP7_RUMAL|nr:conserved domain protein [Ruminococcus albus 8]